MISVYTHAKMISVYTQDDFILCTLYLFQYTEIVFACVYTEIAFACVYTIVIYYFCIPGKSRG